jgi:amidophosphoribosyltransferase
MKKEACGLFGIYGHPEAARMTYFGLYALQHRGQESAGIITWDGQTIREQRGMGLVADVFNERHLGHQLKGSVAMGHIRYSTTGASLIRNAQPFKVTYKGLNLAVAHNGNLVNTIEPCARSWKTRAPFSRPPWTARSSCTWWPST